MKPMRRIWAVMKKEMLHISRDFIMFSVCFIAPLLLMMLSGFLYSQHKVIHVPIVIYDQDQSELSRTVIRAFGDSERFSIVATAASEEEYRQNIATEKAFVAIVIPHDFQKDIKEGKSSEVGLMINGTNIIITNTAVTYANQIIQTFCGGVTMKVIEGLGVNPKKAYQAVTAVSFQYRIWYNPTNSYLLFMLPGLIGVILQQVSLLGIALSFSREREHRTWKQLVFSKLRSFEVILGKYLLYLIIFTLEAVLLYWIGFSYFGLPMRGDLGLLFGTAILFVNGILALGILLSVLAKTTAQAIELSMLLAVPSFLVSGYTFPYFSMPPGIKLISNALPLTYYLQATRSEIMMGNGMPLVGRPLFILSLFAIICLPLAFIVIERRMKRDCMMLERKDSM